MITRRSLLKAGIIASVGSSFPAPALAIKPKVRLRVLGTHVTLQEEIRQRAERELGFEIEFRPGGSAQVLYQASTQPESFDIYEQWSNSIRVLWNSGAIQAIDIQRLRAWDEINDLTKVGRLTPGAPLGAGDAPFKLLFIQRDGSLGTNRSQEISFMPYVHNVDSFGYNASVVPEGEAYKTESWAWLLDERWRGKVALVNAPTIGIFDLALAASGAGLVELSDLGNLSRSEVDRIFGLYLDLQRNSHFRTPWGSVPESVELMKTGKVVIESMFSPAATSLRGQGINCIYAAPKEGYRAWHGVMCLSSKAEGYVKDAAYDFMNWWLSGWPGAFIARQGYYISNPQRSREHLSVDEWDYWYDGKIAQRDLPGTDGKTVAKKGSFRRGGGYLERFSHVAVWNTVMDTYEYSLQRWGELLE